MTKKCGCFKPNPVEELPAPEHDEPEELPFEEDEQPKPIIGEGDTQVPLLLRTLRQGQSDSDTNKPEKVKAREEVGSATRNFTCQTLRIHLCLRIGR